MARAAPGLSAFLVLALCVLANATTAAAQTTGSLSGGDFLIPPNGSAFDRSVSTTTFGSVECFPSERRVGFTIQNGFLNFASSDFVVTFSTEDGPENARSFSGVAPGESERLYVSPINPSQKIGNRRNELTLIGQNKYTGFSQIFKTRVPDCGPIRDSSDDGDTRADDDDAGFFDVQGMIDNDTLLHSALAWMIVIAILIAAMTAAVIILYIQEAKEDALDENIANSDQRATSGDRQRGVHRKWSGRRAWFIKDALASYNALAQV